MIGFSLRARPVIDAWCVRILRRTTYQTLACPPNLRPVDHFVPKLGYFEDRTTFGMCIYSVHFSVFICLSG